MPAIATLPETRTRTVDLVLDPPRRDRPGDGRLRLAGYAAVYNTPSEDIGFREVLEPGCFARALERPDCDVLLFWSHDRGSPLARQSAGSLRVREDERGLRFEAELAPTTLAEDVMVLVREGVIRQMSFGFSYASDGGGVRWERRDGETYCYVSEVGRLHEVSLVAEPAYTATSVEARAAARGRLRVREQSPYGPDGRYSWFWDILTVSEAERGAEAAARAGRRRFGPAEDMDAGLRHRDWGGLQEARQRLAAVTPPHGVRDVATAQLAGMASAVAVPEFVATTFASAVRSRAVIASALTGAELPPGFTVPGPYQAPRLTTGAAAASQTAENSAVSEQDPAGAGVDLEVATVAGQVDVSRQLLERGALGDAWVARELGEALATVLDTQLLTGSGAAGQLRGLLNVSGIGSVSYTDASPTQAECWPRVLEALSTVATGLGAPADLALLHPRRWLWLSGWKDSGGALSPPVWPVEPVLAATIPTNLGAGTNEDALVVLRREDVILLTRQPVFRAYVEPAAGALTVRCLAWQFAALHVRQPEAVCALTGTGLATPTFA